VPTGPKRTHGTVYASFDGGLTWPVKKTLVPGEFAYSNLVQLADGRIGLFYEARNHLDLKLTRFPLAWLTGATATPTSQEPRRD
jgi:sialidase-1